MVASSVPVRKDVPNIKEDLDAAGIRFVYFSGKLSEVNLLFTSDKLQIYSTVHCYSSSSLLCVIPHSIMIHSLHIIIHPSHHHLIYPFTYPPYYHSFT